MLLLWQCGQAFYGLISLPRQNTYMYYAEVFNYGQNVTIRFHLQEQLCTASHPSFLFMACVHVYTPPPSKCCGQNSL